MENPEFKLAGVIVRKAAQWSFGWFARNHYNRIFRVYWERQEVDRDLAGSDWKKIFVEARNEPAPIFISAGDLFFMGPLLVDLKKGQECRWCVNKICIKRISTKLFDYLTDSKSFLPIVGPNLLRDLDSKVTELKETFGHDNVEVADWDGLPRFAGATYRDFLMYHPWQIDRQGRLTHKALMKFMNRKFDPQFFDDYRDAIRSGFSV